MYDLSNIQTGDILGVEGVSFLARAIQKFQSLSNKESAHINHTGIFWWINRRLFVIEAAEKGITITNFDKYLKSKSKLYRFRYIGGSQKNYEKQLEDIFFENQNFRYEYLSLFKYQIIRTLFGKWTGGKTSKKMVCHEWTQKAWNEVRGIFPEWYKGDVSKIYHSMLFQMEKIK